MIVVGINSGYLLDNVLVRGLSPIRKRKTPLRESSFSSSRMLLGIVNQLDYLNL